jgi:hypothetical protein
MLSEPEVLEGSCRAARAYVRGKSSQLDGVADRLISGLKLEEQLS